MANIVAIPGPISAAPQPQETAPLAIEGGSGVSTAQMASVTTLTIIGTLSQVGGYLGHIVSKIKYVASILAVAAGYISGVTNLATGAFEAYWLARKVSFHKKIDKGLKEAGTTEEKSKIIWDAYSAFLKIDEAPIDKEMKKFSEKSVEKQAKDFWKTYDEEVKGSWGDYFGNIAYKIKAYVHRKFGKEYHLKNLIQERLDATEVDRGAFETKLLDPALTAQEKKVLIADKNREILVKRAERIQLAALEEIVSTTFAHELDMNKDNIDLSKVEHQEALVELHGRVSANYKANLAADVVECVGHIAMGAISIASMVFVKAAALRLMVTAIGVFVNVRTVYKTTNAVRRLFGADLPETFAKETSEVFKAFKDHEITPLPVLEGCSAA